MIDPQKSRSAKTTLIELLCVIAMISILLGCLGVVLEPVWKKSREKSAMEEEAAAREVERKRAAEESVAARQRAEAATEAQRRDLDVKLASFTKEHVPELHAAINRIGQAIQDWTARCEEIESDLRLVNKDPTKDPDVQRWRTAIEQMKKRLVELREQRREAWIAYRKFERAPSGKSDYERQLVLANKAAADSQVYHKKMQERLESK